MTLSLFLLVDIKRRPSWFDTATWGFQTTGGPFWGPHIGPGAEEQPVARRRLVEFMSPGFLKSMNTLAPTPQVVAFFQQIHAMVRLSLIFLGVPFSGSELCRCRLVVSLFCSCLAGCPLCCSRAELGVTAGTCCQGGRGAGVARHESGVPCCRVALTSAIEAASGPSDACTHHFAACCCIYASREDRGLGLFGISAQACSMYHRLHVICLAFRIASVVGKVHGTGLDQEQA